MLPILLLSATSFASEPASEDCQKVREVHSMARAAALDTTTLDVLSQRLCGNETANATPEPSEPAPFPKVPPPEVEPACSIMKSVYWLGYLDMDSASLQEINQAFVRACKDGSMPEVWQNGISASRPDGSVFWPNGQLARRADGALWWPNGRTAFADKTWSYPDGRVAKGQDGRWRRPDGVTTGSEGDMRSWGCAQSQQYCGFIDPAIEHLSGDARTIAVFGLAYLASQP